MADSHRPVAWPVLQHFASYLAFGFNSLRIAKLCICTTLLTYLIARMMFFPALLPRQLLPYSYWADPKHHRYMTLHLPIYQYLFLLLYPSHCFVSYNLFDADSSGRSACTGLEKNAGTRNKQKHNDNILQQTIKVTKKNSGI